MGGLIPGLKMIGRNFIRGILFIKAEDFQIFGLYYFQICIYVTPGII